MSGEIRQLEVVDQRRIFSQEPSAGIEDVEYPEDVIGVIVQIHLTSRSDVAHGIDGRRQLGRKQTEGPEEHQQREPEPPGAEVCQPVEHGRHCHQEHHLRDGGPLAHLDAGEVQGQDAGLNGTGGGGLRGADGVSRRGSADGEQVDHCRCKEEHRPLSRMLQKQQENGGHGHHLTAEQTGGIVAPRHERRHGKKQDEPADDTGRLFCDDEPDEDGEIDQGKGIEQGIVAASVKPEEGPLLVRYELDGAQTDQHRQQHRVFLPGVKPGDDGSPAEKQRGQEQSQHHDPGGEEIQILREHTGLEGEEEDRREGALPVAVGPLHLFHRRADQVRESAVLHDHLVYPVGVPVIVIQGMGIVPGGQDGDDAQYEDGEKDPHQPGQRIGSAFRHKCTSSVKDRIVLVF